ncbi:MAG: hypothetical protein QOH75_2504 [Actinomycetota bacterium]|nr:hypothetical protein [Actinomycetota bacterium]
MYKTQLETARLACTSPRSGSAPERSGEAVASPVGAHREDEQSVAAIHRALDEGIHWIDTAAGSGFGQSEEVVGRALNSLAAKPYFVTNCSLLEVPAGRWRTASTAAFNSSHRQRRCSRNICSTPGRSRAKSWPPPSRRGSV